MMKPAGILSVFIVFILCVPVTAQNGSQPLTLEECINIALKKNSTLKTASYEVDRAGANVKASYSNVLPRITSTFQSGRSTVGQTTNLVSSQVFDFATVVDTTGEPIDIAVPRVDPQTGQFIIDREERTSPTRSFWGHSMTLSYSQTLFDFGRSWNLIRQAKASFNSSSNDLTAARLEVYSSVKERYFELLKAVKLQEEYRLAVERSKEQLQRTQSMYEIGSVAQIDVYKQEVTLGQDEINFINQQNIVKIARGNLNVAMGRDPETPIQVVDVEQNQSPLNISLEEAYDIAEKNNPELKSFEYDMEAAEYGRKAAKGRYWPSIGIGATYSRDNEQFNRVYSDFGENFFVNIGARIDLNIFNGFSDYAEVQRQTANYSIAEESWINQKRNIHLQVKQAYLNLQAYREISRINERNLRSAEEDFRLAQERYRVGAGTQLEVTDAQVALTRARVNLVRTKYDAMIAQAQLETAMGVVDDVGAESEN